MVLRNLGPIFGKARAEEWVGGASKLVRWVGPYVGIDRIADRTGEHLSKSSATINHCARLFGPSHHRHNVLYLIMCFVEDGFLFELSNCSAPYVVSAFVI